MLDRHWLGDIGLAVLLAVPTVALSKPQAPDVDRHSTATVLVKQAAAADRSPADRRFALTGRA